MLHIPSLKTAEKKKHQVFVDKDVCVFLFRAFACSAVSGVSILKQQAAHRWEEEKNHQHNINIIQSFWEAFLSCRWNCSLESMPAHCFPPHHLHHLLSSLFSSAPSLSPSTSEQVLICREYYCPVPTFAGLRRLVGTGARCDLICSREMCRALKPLPSLACLNIHTHTRRCPWHSKLSDGILQQVHSLSF